MASASKPVPTNRLLDRLKALLPSPREREELERIARGSGVPYHTLLKIANGETSDPRVSTVESLMDYLERKAA